MWISYQCDTFLIAGTLFAELVNVEDRHRRSAEGATPIALLRLDHIVCSSGCGVQNVDFDLFLYNLILPGLVYFR